MKQSYFTDAIKLKLSELFPGLEFSGAKFCAVRKYTFKTMRLGDSYALLAVICPILTALVGLLRGKSALFQVRDCFECLSPTLNAA